MLRHLINLVQSTVQNFMNLPQLKNEVGFSEELIKLLVSDFQKLESIDTGLPHEIARYVIDADEPDFPATLAARLAKKPLTGTQYSFSHSAPHGGFFRKYDLTDAAPLFRLAEVYDAMAQTQGVTNFFYSRSCLKFPALDLTAFIAVLFNAFQNQTSKFPVDLVEQIFTRASGKPDALARLVFILDLNAPRWDTFWLRSEIVKYRGFMDFALRHKEIIREALNLPKSEQKAQALEILNQQNVPIDEFVAEISALACATTKTVRNEASLLLKKCQPDSIPFLREIAAKGSSGERANACRRLFEFEGEKSFEFLQSRLEKEKTANVRETIDELLNPEAIQADAEQEFNFEIPPLPAVEASAPLSEDFFNNLSKAFDRLHQTSLDQYETNKQYGWAREPKEISPEKRRKFFELMQNGKGYECAKFSFSEENQNLHWGRNHLTQAFLRAETKPIHLVRLSLILQNTHNFLAYINMQFPEFRSLPNFANFSARELAQILEALETGEYHIGQALFHRTTYYNPLEFFIETDENFWHYLFDKQDEIEKALFSNEAYKRQNALIYLSKFPQIPPRFRARLWEFALGKTKTERSLAQKCLEKDSYRFARLLEALKNRSAEVRSIAADWLGNAGETAAIEPLRQAIGTEKSDAAKDAMLRALERLGASVEEYLDRDRLADEAASNLKGDAFAKTVPWLNADLLPKISWADNGKEAAPEILKWFILQSVKQKQIEISPLLRRYFEKFETSGREKFGQFVLESWIAADTQPFAPDEAEAKAKTLLAQAKGYWKYYQEQGFTEDSFFQQQFNHFLKAPRGSAIKEKGILAIAGACCNGSAVAPIERYIREFHGHRLKQSLALVEILGALGDLSAIQVLLSLANRFRTKGIHEEAKRQVDMLAERNGWTLDELADRTIPTLGFDARGELKLDYGSRQFSAKLDKDFNFLLFDGEGKKIKSLPATRKEDDADSVKEAKLAFTNAKKNLKQILALQKERLHEAMCSQRSWKFADWQAFLNNHPILRRYCQTLVWQTVGAESELSFRPLDDGTLTDADDNEVNIENETLVKLAHQQTVKKDVAAAWTTHLADYEITPIFAQFGREMPALDEEAKNKTEIKDFEGYMIETFKLRGKATSLGFKRGAVEDAGWFYTYRKSFPSLEIEAFIEFTGNFVPEENRPSALMALSFARLGRQESGYLSPDSSLRLKDVPPVILCEVWNDWKTIAMTGTGFDEDWKKKSEY